MAYQNDSMAADVDMEPSVKDECREDQDHLVIDEEKAESNGRMTPPQSPHKTSGPVILSSRSELNQPEDLTQPRDLVSFKCEVEEGPIKVSNDDE